MLRYCLLNKDGAYNRGASLAAEDPIVAKIRRLEAEAAHLRALYTASYNFVAMRTFNLPSGWPDRCPSPSRPPSTPPRRHRASSPTKVL